MAAEEAAMTGEAHWMDAVLMLVGAGAILLYIWRAGRIDVPVA